MINTQFEAYKIKRELKRNGSEFVFIPRVLGKSSGTPLTLNYVI